MRYFQEQTGERSYAVMYAADELQQKDIGPLVVPPGEVFLMGDNRDASADSRYWGSLPLDTIDGRVLAVWFSLDWSPGSGSQGPQVRWERLGLQF